MMRMWMAVRVEDDFGWFYHQFAHTHNAMYRHVSNRIVEMRWEPMCVYFLQAASISAGFPLENLLKSQGSMTVSCRPLGLLSNPSHILTHILLSLTVCILAYFSSGSYYPYEGDRVYIAPISSTHSNTLSQTHNPRSLLSLSLTPENFSTANNSMHCIAAL